MKLLMKPYCASINYHYDALYEYLINLPTLHLISGYALGLSCSLKPLQKEAVMKFITRNNAGILTLPIAILSIRSVPCGSILHSNSY